ncbi:hypothetical protein GA0070616_4342 [Micromonospora nigra]|uniref:Uncharacterized protein n=1 Tax=Micromonospora nigra TaxID=145857 RepID=A0A1C6SRA8_9ACTN|nr:hypothetical protein [Micromonospora nigra]SCL31843.1 hypothetical protein GA0070616_4342 [Micromonospora nigra]
MSDFYREQYNLWAELATNAAGARGGIGAVLGMLDKGQITPEQAVELIRGSIAQWETADKATQDSHAGGAR